MDALKILDVAKNISIVSLLLCLLYLSSIKKWVWGDQLEEEKKRTMAALADRDMWQKLAIQATKFAEEAMMKSSDYKMNALPVDSAYTIEDAIRNKLKMIRKALYPDIEDRK